MWAGPGSVSGLLPELQRGHNAVERAVSGMHWPGRGLMGLLALLHHLNSPSPLGSNPLPAGEGFRWVSQYIK